MSKCKKPKTGKEKPEAIIVGVDGTLAHKCNRGIYDASKAMDDTMDDAVGIITAMAYKNDYKVIILTDRFAEYKQVTEDWLEANGLNYDEIYTRADGDVRQDAIVKKELYEKHIKDRYKIKFVMDDRNQVVNMWRVLGLKCLQVAPGDV